jgi:hypothetical protein
MVLKYVTKNGMRIRNAARQALLGHQTTSKAEPPRNSALKVVVGVGMPFDRTVTWRQFAH